MGCPFSNILGTPKEGVHATRIAGFAFYDILATIIAAALTTYFYEVHFAISITGWFLLGELLHYIFGVQTQVLTVLGIRAC